jgi:hypothetical protein
MLEASGVSSLKGHVETKIERNHPEKKRLTP